MKVALERDEEAARKLLSEFYFCVWVVAILATADLAIFATAGIAIWGHFAGVSDPSPLCPAGPGACWCACPPRGGVNKPGY